MTNESNQQAIEEIEWHVSLEYPGWVCAEDQPLFEAGRYVQRVVDDHNFRLVRERAKEDDNASGN